MPNGDVVPKKPSSLCSSTIGRRSKVAEKSNYILAYQMRSESRIYWFKLCKNGQLLKELVASELCN